MSLIGWHLKSLIGLLAVIAACLVPWGDVASAQSADLSVTKTDSPDPVVAGTNLTYALTVANAGPSSAQNVTLSDAVPANTTFVSATQTSGPAFTLQTPAAGGTGTVTATVGTFASGPSANFTLVVNVNPNVPQGGTITNTASVTSTTSDPNTANNADTEATAVNTQANLSVTKTDSPDPVTAGNNLTYTLTVANAGPSNAQNVSLTDAIPAGTTFVSASQTSGPAFTLTTPPAGGTGTFTATTGTLVAGASATFTLVVNVNSRPSSCTISNTASTTTSTTDSNGANNSDTETTGVANCADLSLTTTDSPNPVAPGQNLTYTLTLANAGPNPAQNVTLSDAVPANTTFVSATQTGGPAFTLTPPAAGGTGTVTATRSSFAAGARATFQLVVAVSLATPPGATITNSAAASSTTVDPNGAADTETTVVNRSPVAANDSVSTPEDTPLTVPAPGVLANDSDPDPGATLAAELVTGPANGTLTLNPNGSFTYTPNPNFSGSDSFTYRASDGATTSGAATVAIAVGAANDPPTISDISDQTIPEDSGLGPVGFTVGDAETEAAALTVSATSDNPTLVPVGVIAVGGSGRSRTIAIAPAANQFGSATIAVTVTDAQGGTATDTFVLTVVDVPEPPPAAPVPPTAPANNAPVARGDAFFTGAGRALVVNRPGVLANDADREGAALTALLVRRPARGAVALAADGSFIYLPGRSFRTSDSFAYRVTDGTNSSGTVTVTISVPVCFGRLATIVGTPGNDVLNGTPGDDVIAGLGGNDRINGLGGNDRLCGGDGNDRLSGGPGNDQLDGGAGLDQLAGDAGDDRLIGGAGIDSLLGGPGVDTLLGGPDGDRLFGGPGDDRLVGEAGNDRLAGEAGNDRLVGAAGRDTCVGGPGVDTAATCEVLNTIP